MSKSLRHGLTVDAAMNELIHMDLVRSMDFFEQKHYDDAKLILINLAVDYPDVSYYQGMNYLVIFCFYTCNRNATMAYWLMSFMVEHCLQAYFGHSFQGLVRLLFVVDKLLHRIYPTMWHKLAKGGVTSIHFCVPMLITLFTSMIKSEDAYAYIADIWDAVVARGMYPVVKALLLLLEVQQSHLMSLSHEDLLLVMKNVEKDPFAVIPSTGKSTGINRYYAGIGKKFIEAMELSDATISTMESFYTRVRKVINDTWEHADGR
jgi:Rab-GTPase-TBC domain